MRDTIYRDDAIKGAKELYQMGDCYCDEYGMVGMLNSLPSARKKYHVAQERYEDLCEYFGYNEDTIKRLLGSRKEFKSWLERMRWHVLKCDELARMLDAQPEIIRCKECGLQRTCKFSQYQGADGFCSFAERRVNGCL